MTPEQRIEQTISERVAGLWNRWYASGRLEPIDGAALPQSYRGWERPYLGGTIREPLTRARIRQLVSHIEAEHDKGSPL